MINNKVIVPKTKNIKIQIRDFKKGLDVSSSENLTSFDSSINCFNLDFNGGCLTSTIGVKKFTTPINKDSDETQIELNKNGEKVKPKNIWLFKQYSTVYNERTDKLVFYGDDKHIWYVKLLCEYPYYSKLIEPEIANTPKYKNQKILGLDSVIISNSLDGVFTWNGDGSIQSLTNCPKVVNLCEHKNKLYGVIGGEQNKIRYSTDFNLSNWNDLLSENDGIIEMNDSQGKINKLVSFYGYLFAFRDYGITKITTYDNFKNYSITNLYDSGNKIYPDTIEICGEDILMLTKDGIVLFDGISTKTIDLKFNKMLLNLDNKNAVACFHAGKYYLSCKMNYNDNKLIGCENSNYINNTLICYDVKTNEYSIVRGIDIIDIKSFQVDSLNKVVVCFNGEYSSEIGELTFDGKVFDKNTYKYWCSPLTDLGYSNKIKVVKSVSLLSKYDCKFTVFTEKEEKIFNIKGKNLLTKIPVRLKGEQIGFKIETENEKVDVSNVIFDIDLIENKSVI